MCRPDGLRTFSMFSGPGTSVPGYRLCRPNGLTASACLPQATRLGGAGADVMCRPDGLRNFSVFSGPGTSVPGYRLCRPDGLTASACLRQHGFEALERM